MKTNPDFCRSGFVPNDADYALSGLFLFLISFSEILGFTSFGQSCLVFQPQRFCPVEKSVGQEIFVDLWRGHWAVTLEWWLFLGALHCQMLHDVNPNCWHYKCRINWLQWLRDWAEKKHKWIPDDKMDLSEPILIGQRSIFLFWPLAIPIAKDVLTYHLLLIAFHVFPSRSAFSSLHLCSKNQKPVFEPGIKLEGLLASVTFRKLGLANWGALNMGCKGFFFTFPFCLPTWSNPH